MLDDGTIAFQYIQCYFLSAIDGHVVCVQDISIHPMLFFIVILLPLFHLILIFQYIQCYFLSGSGSGAATMYYNFNTSNVIFYPWWEFSHRKQVEFQYIQCYFLSVFRAPFLCYLHNFNTSNVIFYQSSGEALLNTCTDFNTSNVIFYPEDTGANQFKIRFQYIQCYFLSFLPTSYRRSF